MLEPLTVSVTPILVAPEFGVMTTVDVVADDSDDLSLSGTKRWHIARMIMAEPPRTPPSPNRVQHGLLSADRQVAKRAMVTQFKPRASLTYWDNWAHRRLQVSPM